MPELRLARVLLRLVARRRARGRDRRSSESCASARPACARTCSSASARRSSRSSRPTAWATSSSRSATGVTFDPTRIAAQIVTGIGFLGAGAIIRQGLSVRGLTTAASLWVVAAIGMAAGAGYYIAAVIDDRVVLLSLVAARGSWRTGSSCASGRASSAPRGRPRPASSPIGACSIALETRGVARPARSSSRTTATAAGSCSTLAARAAARGRLTAELLRLEPVLGVPVERRRRPSSPRRTSTSCASSRHALPGLGDRAARRRGATRRRTGETYYENALAKARFGRSVGPAGRWVIGEDSGSRSRASAAARASTRRAGPRATRRSGLLEELDGRGGRGPPRALRLRARRARRPTGTELRGTGSSRAGSRTSRAARKASASTRSSSRTARSGPWPSSATNGRRENSHRARAARAPAGRSIMPLVESIDSAVQAPMAGSTSRTATGSTETLMFIYDLARRAELVSVSLTSTTRSGCSSSRGRSSCARRTGSIALDRGELVALPGRSGRSAQGHEPQRGAREDVAVLAAGSRAHPRVASVYPRQRTRSAPGACVSSLTRPSSSRAASATAGPTSSPNGARGFGRTAYRRAEAGGLLRARPPRPAAPREPPVDLGAEDDHVRHQVEPDEQQRRRAEGLQRDHVLREPQVDAAGSGSSPRARPSRRSRPGSTSRKVSFSFVSR